MKKKNDHSAEERLFAIHRLKNETAAEIAKSIGVHHSTVSRWEREYRESGAAALGKERRHYNKGPLPIPALRAALATATEKEREEIESLIELSATGRTAETAEKHGISPQGLLIRKRKWRNILNGTAPPKKERPKKKEPEPGSFAWIAKEYNIRNRDMADIFGLSEDSFKNSSARRRYEAAVENLYKIFFTFTEK